MKRTLSLFLVLLLSFSLISCSSIDSRLEGEINSIDIEEDLNNEVIKDIEEDGYYTSKEDVSLYIHTYGNLPGNYITKKKKPVN